MSIRCATAADLDALLALERACFAHAAYPPFPLRQFLDLCPHSTLVAERDGAVVAYALGAMRSTTEHDEAWLLALGVHPEHRGQGLARSLSQALIQALGSLGARRILLTTEPDNQAAIGLYRGLGFRRDSEISDYFGPGEDRVVMVRD